MDLKMMNAAELAFVGDAVFELLVRSRIARATNTSPNTLHRMSVECVCAAAQSGALEAITPLLDEQALSVVRRGKNCTKTTVPKHSSPQLYRNATALEALFGYLYLSGSNDRVAQLFAAVCDYYDSREKTCDGDCPAQ